MTPPFSKLYPYSKLPGKKASMHLSLAGMSVLVFSVPIPNHEDVAGRVAPPPNNWIKHAVDRGEIRWEREREKWHGVDPELEITSCRCCSQPAMLGWGEGCGGKAPLWAAVFVQLPSSMKKPRRRSMKDSAS